MKKQYSAYGTSSFLFLFERLLLSSQNSNCIFLLIISLTGFKTFSQTSYDRKYTSQSKISMAVSNNGIIGNAFDRDFTANNLSSCEFPKGSGTENLFEGALWVGGYINGSQVAVSTGAFDNSSGYSTGSAGYEFTTPLGSKLVERSSLPDNSLYNPQAVSHQDFISDFTDKNIYTPGTNILIQDHTNPMGISVHMEAYNWNHKFANFFVPINFTIKNTGTATLDSVYLGYWSNFVIRNTNVTPPGGTPFFNKGGCGYIDSLNLSYQFDALGDTAYTKTYASMRFLGATDKYGFHTPKLDPNFKCNYNVWQFKNTGDPVYFAPGDDGKKYSKLATGLNSRTDWNTLIRGQIKAAGNRTNMISVGPFKPLAPGDSIQISFSLIFAPKTEDGKFTNLDTDEQKKTLVNNAKWAEIAFNGNDKNGDGIVQASEDIFNNGKIKRWLLPSAPDVPKNRMVVRDNAVDIYWTKNSENSVDPISNKKDFAGYRLYRTDLGFDTVRAINIESSLKLVFERDKRGDTLFKETGFNDIILEVPKVFEGDTNKYFYKYTFSNLANGWQYGIAITAFDQGDKQNNVESLENSNLITVKYIYPGKEGNSNISNVKPFVYPNPYYGGASWEGTIRLEEERKLYFSNLPKNAEIRIYSQSGDLINKINHDPTFNGTGLRWYNVHTTIESTQMSGGEHAWNLVSTDNQLIAAGVYTYTVLDKESGKAYTGQFAVIR